MHEKFYSYSPAASGETRVRVGLIFEDRDRHLSTIQENVRKLEFAVPFPCTKSDPEIVECRKKGHRGKLMATLYITGEEIKWPEAQKFLEGAGFQKETS